MGLTSLAAILERRTALWLHAVISLILLAGVLVTAGACPRQTIAGRVDTLAVVAGVLSPAVRQGLLTPAAPVDARMSLSVAISLASRDPSGLQAALRALYQPGNPLYHHFFSAGAVQARFGPDPTAVQDLVRWLGMAGLTTRPWSGSSILSVTGTAAQFSTAFHIGLWRYRPSTAVAGTVVSGALSPAVRRSGYSYAPDRDPLVPSRFASLIQGIVGLQSLDQSASVAAARAGTSRVSRGPAGGYDPSEIGGAYNFRSLYAAGFHGEHTRVALVELAAYDPVDVATYTSWAGVSPVIQDISVDGGNASADPNVEATMDVELLSALAPGAAIDVYNAPNDKTGVSLLDAYSDVFSAGNAQVLSLSWTTCESRAAQIPGFVAAEHALFVGLTLEGTTIVSATGDTGAYACATPTSSGAVSVNLPASDPYSLAVGATELTIRTVAANGLTQYDIALETAWSCSARVVAGCGYLSPIGLGTGGGISALFYTGDAYGDNLGWQANVGAPSAAAAKARRLPDVAFSGSSTNPQHEYAIYWKRRWNFAGGTSASAPAWAAIILLVDQYLEAHNRPGVGWVNPTVYQIGGTLQPFPPFHDVVGGNNFVYDATAGWDFATGWGTPDAYDFALDVGCAAGLCPGVVRTAPFVATATSRPSNTPPRTPTASASRTRTPSPTARRRVVATASRTPRAFLPSGS